MPRARLSRAALLVLRAGGAAARPRPPAAARWSKSTTWSSAPTAASSRGRCRAPRYAPIEFQGHFDIAAKDGGRPVALRQASLDFDRDGRLSAAGLPTCAAERVADASAEEARPRLRRRDRRHRPRSRRWSTLGGGPVRPARR